MRDYIEVRTQEALHVACVRGQRLMDTAIIITARGGSKRLPRKNVRQFCGKPLIAWTVMAAKQSKLAREVFVSTDDDEVAHVSAEFGASVIKRGWISGDKEYGCVPVVKALDWIKVNRDWEPELLMTMLPTWPCRDTGGVDAGIKMEQEFGWWMTYWGYSAQETGIHRKLRNGAAICVLSDKEWRYVKWTAGDSVSLVTSYREYVDRLLVGDIDDLNIMYDPTGIVPIKLWQVQDTDTEEQFEAAEYWFKRKMIDVYGENPYGG